MFQQQWLVSYFLNATDCSNLTIIVRQTVIYSAVVFNPGLHFYYHSNLPSTMTIAVSSRFKLSRKLLRFGTLIWFLTRAHMKLLSQPGKIQGNLNLNVLLTYIHNGRDRYLWNISSVVYRSTFVFRYFFNALYKVMIILWL